MKQVYYSDVSQTPPSLPASATEGYPQDGTVSGNAQATVPGAYWFYQVSAEIENAIRAGGLTPDAARVNQLAEIIANIHAASHAVSYLPQTLTAAQKIQARENIGADNVVNVRDFGAKGDGVADDTAAIEAATAEAAGKCLFFPAGTYLTSKGLRIPSNTCVRGENRYNTTIRLTSDAFNCPCISTAGINDTDPYATQECAGIIIENLTADGNGTRDASGSAAQYGSAICLTNCHDVIVRNCRAINGRLHCLDVMSCYYGGPVADDSIYYTGASYNIVIDNVIAANPVLDDCITTHYSHNIVINNCLCYHDSLDGLAYNQVGIEIDDGSYDVHVSNCYVHTCARGYVVAKGHVTDAGVNTPIRNVSYTACVAEGCITNWYGLYRGSKPSGITVLNGCASISPQFVQTLYDETSDTSIGMHFATYGMNANLVVDGFSMTGGNCAGGIYINPSDNTSAEQYTLRNVYARDVSIDSALPNQAGGLIRLTGNVSAAKNVTIENVTAVGCSDVPVIYATTAFLPKIDGVNAVAGQAYASPVIRVNNGAIASPSATDGFAKRIHHVNYACAFNYGSANFQVADLTTSRLGSAGDSTAVAFTNDNTVRVGKRYVYTRNGAPVPTGAGVAIALGRRDSVGDLDDVLIGTSCAYSAGIGSLTFGVRDSGATAPETRWVVQATEVTTGDKFCFRPAVSNTYSIGRSGYVVSEVFAGSGSINTSDRRQKDNIADPSDALMRAWGKVRVQVFQFKDALAKKGDGARVHVGLVAQDVVEAFASEGLDAARYGLLCHDSWDDEYEDVEVIDVPAVVNENGEEVEPATTHTERRLIRQAGDAYGIRYSEALALECAYLRWRMEQLEARLEANNG